MTRLFAAPLAVLLTVALPVHAAPITAVEQGLVETVRSEHDRALALLQETVDINSGTMNFAGVRRVGDVFAREFRELGFRVEWIEGSGFHRAGHLVAHHDGASGSPKVLLIGHLDTVFAEDSPFQTLQLTGPKAGSGPGVNDMKGGDVIIVQALRALKAHGQLDRLSLRVVLTGDEENSGEPIALSKQALFEAGDWADVALGFENADGLPENAAVSRRGAAGWQLEVTGTAAHSSQLFQPEVGAGAIYEAARILDAFRTRLSGMQDLTFSPGVIVGGTDVSLDHDSSRGTAFGKDNVVARSVRVDGDLRAVSPGQLKAAQALMRDIIATPLPGTQATIRFDDGYPPMAPTPGNLRLLALYDAASRDLGQGPVGKVHPRKAGAADISFVADRVDMAIDGLGLKGPGNHTVDEVAILSTLESQTLRAALLLQRLPETVQQ
jgi:glutamate carboxypeptidase